MSNKSHLFQPGESGNPKGRPKGSISVVSALKRKLEEETDETMSNGDKLKVVDMLVETIMDKALTDKDVSMIKDIIDRVDGKAVQRQELTGKDGETLSITVTKEIEKALDEL